MGGEIIIDAGLFWALVVALVSAAASFGAAFLKLNRVVSDVANLVAKDDKRWEDHHAAHEKRGRENDERMGRTERSVAGVKATLAWHRGGEN